MMSNKILWVFFVLNLLNSEFSYAQNLDEYNMSEFIENQFVSEKILSIDEMFRLADANSKSLKVHQSDLDYAAQNVKISKNSLLPSIDIQLSASYLGDGYLINRNFTGGMNAPMPHFGNNLAIDASQVVYAGGAIKNGVEVAKLQEQIVSLALENNRQEIHFLLVSYYLQLYQLYNQDNILDKNISLQVHLLENIKNRYNEGTVLKNDITRNELQLQNLELSKVETQNLIAIYNRQLVSVLNIDPLTRIIPDSSIFLQSFDYQQENIWRELAMSSPVLQQSNLTVEMNKKLEKIERADRLPSVALVASNHLDGPITIEVPPIDKNFNYWYVGVGVKYDIASLYKSKKKLNLAKISTQKAQNSYLLEVEHVENNVYECYVNYIESFVRLPIQEKNVQLAEENYNMVYERYMNDHAILSDMIDAANSLLNAELQVENTRINLILNYYKLKKSVGDI